LRFWKILKEIKEFKKKKKGGGAMKVTYVLCRVNPFDRTITPFAILKFSSAIHFVLSNAYDGITFFYRLANVLHERYPEVFPSYFDEYKRKREYWYNLYCDTQKRVLLRLKEQIKKELQDYYTSKKALNIVVKEKTKEILEALPVYEI
jgi:ribosomal protein S17E